MLCSLLRVALGTMNTYTAFRSSPSYVFHLHFVGRIFPDRRTCRSPFSTLCAARSGISLRSLLVTLDASPRLHLPTFTTTTNTMRTADFRRIRRRFCLVSLFFFGLHFLKCHRDGVSAGRDVGAHVKCDATDEKRPVRFRQWKRHFIGTTELLPIFFRVPVGTEDVVFFG